MADNIIAPVESSPGTVSFSKEEAQALLQAVWSYEALSGCFYLDSETP